MKPLHIVHGYYPSIGGSQWLVQQISEQLVARYQDEVTVFTTVAYNTDYFWRAGEPALPAGVETINGVVVRRFPVFNRLNTLRMVAAAGAYRLHLPYNDWLRTLYNGPLIPGMTRAIAHSGAEVVFATAFPLMHMYNALKGAHRAHIPVVFLGAIHTADPWGYERPMIYRAIQQADAYIAHTSFERDCLLKHGIAADKIAIIGAGVTPEPFLKADGTLLRQYYGWGNDPVITLIAKQSPRKRFNVLLTAMQQVWPAIPNARLVLAGARTLYTPQLETLIQTLPPEQQRQVTLIHDLPEANKANLLAACDVFVLPSGEESFGIAFLEAWACGKPVVGARVGAIPSVINEGVDGLLFKYDDPNNLAQALLSLLADQAQRIQLGAAGQRKTLTNYTWESVTDRIRQVYKEAIARHSNLTR